MQQQFVTTTPDEPVEELLRRLADERSPTVPVVSDGRLHGLVTLENIGELLLFQSALRTRNAAENAWRADAARSQDSPPV